MNRHEQSERRKQEIMDWYKKRTEAAWEREVRMYLIFGVLFAVLGLSVLGSLIRGAS